MAQKLLWKHFLSEKRALPQIKLSHDTFSSRAITTRNMAERFAWTDEETRYFLNLIEENDITTIFDGKRQRNATTFQDLERKMATNGYTKPWHILCSKWKVLKQRYLAEKRDLSRSGSVGKMRTKLKFFSEMDRILGQRPVVASFSTNINSSSKFCYLFHVDRGEFCLM